MVAVDQAGTPARRKRMDTQAPGIGPEPSRTAAAAAHAECPPGRPSLAWVYRFRCHAEICMTGGLRSRAVKVSALCPDVSFSLAGRLGVYGVMPPSSVLVVNTAAAG